MQNSVGLVTSSRGRGSAVASLVSLHQMTVRQQRPVVF